MDDYPELDEAMLNSLVLDYESKEELPSIDDDPDLQDVPLPPEASHDVALPMFADVLPLEDAFSVEAPVVSSKKLHRKKTEEPILPVEIEPTDVQNLALLENVFDKRITDDDVQRQMVAETRNDSGRLLDKEDVEVKTELNDKEIVTISKLRFIADRYEVPVLREFTDNLMVLKISRNRKGRTEFIQGLHADERREQPSESWLGRVFGGGR